MQPRMFLSRTALACLMLVAGVSALAGTDHPSSGDPEIDAIRAKVRQTDTDADNFRRRGFMMKQWLVALQQQGANVEEYLPVDSAMRRIVPWNMLDRQGYKPQYSEKQMKRLCDLIDRGYRVLEQAQRRVAAGQLDRRAIKASDSDHAILSAAEPLVPWPHYKGNPRRTGYTSAVGAQRGEQMWTFPAGLGWRARPVIEDGRVYVTSPGMRTILKCIDLETGDVIWRAQQPVRLLMDQLYNTPAGASTPIVLEDRILVREMGSRGMEGPARHVVVIDKETGRILEQIEAGHVDYRTGWAPLAANASYMAIPFGVQNIEGKPPTTQHFNRIKLRATDTGRLLWQFNVGPIFARPVLRDNRLWVATRNGYVYCLKADGQYPPVSAKRIAWKFHAGGAVNQAVTVVDGSVYFGANDGVLYSLDRKTGALRWKRELAAAEPRAFRQFSKPLVNNGRVYIGGADKHLYCLDAKTGRVLGKAKSDDWIRAKPIAMGDRVYFASMNGTLHALRTEKGTLKKLWTKQLGRHPIFADLAVQDGCIVVNSSRLITYCVSREGKLQWKHRLLAGFKDDGRYVRTEAIAGGTYYQSKPTAAKGRVYFGAPSGVVYAVSAETGEELWRCELGGAVSAAPEYANGRIYVGQQGGEDEFYCLDAETGEPLWQQATGWVWGSAAVDDGQVFVAAVNGWAYCLDAKTGAIKWRYRTAQSLAAEPLLDEQTVYIGGWGHYLYAFDRNSGEIQWKKQLSGGLDSGVPALADGRIYLPVGGNQFRCIKADTGETLWRFRQQYSNFNATPAYHDGRVYLCAFRGIGVGGIPVSSEVIALDARSGEELWRLDDGGRGCVVGKGGRVFVASMVSPFLYCLDGDGGQNGRARILWTYRMGNRVDESVPALYGDRLYILSSDGYLHAVK